MRWKETRCPWLKCFELTSIYLFNYISYSKPLEYFSDNTDIATKDPNSFMIELKKHFKKFCQSGFCQNTTLHGYNYLCFADSTIYRCIWFILILVMNCVAIYFLGKNTEAYINGGLQYEIETSTASLKVS